MTYQHIFVRFRALAALAGLLVFAAASTAHAQNTAATSDDSFVVRGGGLVALFNSGLRLDRKTALGTDIGFERELGFTKTTTAWFVDASWHISGRHHLYSNFIAPRRDASKAAISQP